MRDFVIRDFVHLRNTYNDAYNAPGKVFYFYFYFFLKKTKIIIFTKMKGGQTGAIFFNTLCWRV